MSSSSSRVKTLMIIRLPYAAAFDLVFPRGIGEDFLLVMVGEDFVLVAGSKYASMICWPVRVALFLSSAL